MYIVFHSWRLLRVFLFDLIWLASYPMSYSVQAIITSSIHGTSANLNKRDHGSLRVSRFQPFHLHVTFLLSYFIVVFESLKETESERESESETEH